MTPIRTAEGDKAAEDVRQDIARGWPETPLNGYAGYALRDGATRRYKQFVVADAYLDVCAQKMVDTIMAQSEEQKAKTSSFICWRIPPEINYWPKKRLWRCYARFIFVHRDEVSQQELAA